MVWNPFRRGPPAGAVLPNAAAINLNRNLRTYVSAYTNARNKNNNTSIPPLNTKVVNALKRYINAKRPKAAGAAAAAVNNAGGSNANAAAAAAGAANASGSSPNNVGAAAAKPLLALGAPPAQVAAAAAGAAKQQALALGMGSSNANNVGANAAANAANAARPSATPQQAANAAATGAAAAGLPANAQGNAAQQAAAQAAVQGPNTKMQSLLRNYIRQGVNRLKNAAAVRVVKGEFNRRRRAAGNLLPGLAKEANNYNRNLNAKLASFTGGGAAGVNVVNQGSGFIPGAPAPANNNRFRAMNIQQLINSTKNAGLSANNKTKLKLAINAKVNSLNENSMNRVRLVTAKDNLN